MPIQYPMNFTAPGTSDEGTPEVFTDEITEVLSCSIERPDAGVLSDGNDNKLIPDVIAFGPPQPISVTITTRDHDGVEALYQKTLSTGKIAVWEIWQHDAARSTDVRRYKLTNVFVPGTALSGNWNELGEMTATIYAEDYTVVEETPTVASASVPVPA